MARIKPIHLTSGSQPGRWIVISEYRYRGVTVEAGFVTDLDSVPRIPGIYSRVKGRTVVAAVIHDWCYRKLVKNDKMTRKAADKLFLRAMKDEGVNLIHRRIIYRAVRMFGGAAVK